MLGNVYGISKQSDVHPIILKSIFHLTTDTEDHHCTHQSVSVTEENKVWSLIESCTHKGTVRSKF